MYISSVSIENFRAFKEKTVFHFNPGVTVLIGENDCGKSTVIDAIRYVLGTTDQSWQRVELSDYHQENTDNEIHITITFSNLTVREKAAFSDAVGHSMVDYLKELAEDKYSDEDVLNAKDKYSYCTPFTKESLMYRDIFESFFPQQGKWIKDFWMPNKEWENCDVDDPSARVLKNYGDSGK